uniref:PDZ domain-containing protein n=1 Tax=Prymnesium polylepis TaxID=72548 RepID=A0A7S4J7N9_9EUKA
MIACSSSAHGLSSPVVARLARRASGGVRNVSPAMDFGDSFYEGFDAWAAEYPEEDRVTYPSLFKLPDNCYEVILEKPLGIAFIENNDGGVMVDYLVDGGNAAASGAIASGDTLLAVTACLAIGPKFERKLIPSRYIDFDTIMGAIGSNEPRFHKKRKNDVILQFARPGAPYENDGDPFEGGNRGVTDYLKSLEFPVDSPWRVNLG